MTTLGSSLPLLHKAVRSMGCGSHNPLASPAAADLYSPREAAHEPQFPLEKGMMTTSPILQGGCQQCVSRELILPYGKSLLNSWQQGPLGLSVFPLDRDPLRTLAGPFFFSCCVFVSVGVYTHVHTHTLFTLSCPLSSLLCHLQPHLLICLLCFSPASCAVLLNGRRN